MVELFVDGIDEFLLFGGGHRENRRKVGGRKKEGGGEEREVGREGMVINRSTRPRECGVYVEVSLKPTPQRFRASESSLGALASTNVPSERSNQICAFSSQNVCTHQSFSKRLRCPRNTPILALISRITMIKKRKPSTSLRPQKTQERKSRKQRPPCALECVCVFSSRLLRDLVYPGPVILLSGPFSSPPPPPRRCPALFIAVATARANFVGLIVKCPKKRDVFGGLPEGWFGGLDEISCMRDARVKPSAKANEILCDL